MTVRVCLRPFTSVTGSVAVLKECWLQVMVCSRDRQAVAAFVLDGSKRRKASVSKSTSRAPGSSGMAHCPTPARMVDGLFESAHAGSILLATASPLRSPICRRRKLGRLRAVYGGADKHLRLAPFFDLLAVHELGHLFHLQTVLTSSPTSNTDASRAPSSRR